MTHEESAGSLSDLLDGALSDGTRDEVSAHVAACAECRAELAVYRRAGSDLLALSDAAATKPTEELVRVLRESLELPVEARFLSGLFSSPQRAVAAFALAAIAFLVAVKPSSRSLDGVAEVMLMSQDDGRTYDWVAMSDAAAAASVLSLEAR